MLYAALRMGVSPLVMAANLVRNRLDPPLLILLYHRVTALKSDPQLLAVSPENFRAQMQYLKDNFALARLEDHWAGCDRTLHDSWAFTGGCHIPLDCRRYTASCGACPALGSDSDSDSDSDLSRRTWQLKARAWRGLPLTVVTPSRWLAGCARARPFQEESLAEGMAWLLKGEVAPRRCQGPAVPRWSPISTSLPARAETRSFTLRSPGVRFASRSKQLTVAARSVASAQR